jgi:hypothetical protein
VTPFKKILITGNDFLKQKIIPREKYLNNYSASGMQAFCLLEGIYAERGKAVLCRFQEI